MSITSKLLKEAIALHRAGRSSDAETLYDEVLAISPELADAWYLKGLVTKEDGRLGEAKAALTQACALNPDAVEPLSALADVEFVQGDVTAAADLYDRVVDLAPDRADFHAVLAGLRFESGELELAEVAARRAVQLDDGLLEAHLNLSLILQAKLDFEGALRSCERAVAIDAEFAHAHFTLGTINLALGNQSAAWDAYHRVLELDVSHAETLINLGNICRERLDIDGAGTFYKRALKAAPDYAFAHSNLGIVLKDQGKMAEALAAFERALDLDPSMHLARSNLLFCMSFNVEMSPVDVLAAHRRFDELHARAFTETSPEHTNDPNPNRPIRVGLMSPDLRIHPGGHFYLPIIEGLARKSVEVYCYYNYIVRDEWTARFETAANRFHHVQHWSDDRLAQQIRSDGIDVLLEGAGHMAGNRLLVAARKPAPIQISMPLYPVTTGLSAIDYRILDERIALPEADAAHSETLIRLPETHFCYRPLERDVQPAPSPPSIVNGYVTFGSFNNAIKLSDRTVEVWSRVLKAVPDSRLALKWLDFDKEESAIILQRFEGCGVDSSRIDRYGWAPDPYTPYHVLDICLDPILTSGGTTTCDALWMGVPVVSMAGRTPFSRTGLVHLTNLDLTEFVADSADQFVEIATRLASDPQKLMAVRHNLRQRMQASPIMDEERYVTFLEAEIRRVWRQWCAGRLTRTGGPRQ